MAYVITLPCIGVKDTACVDVCPVSCIGPTKDDPNFDKEEMLYIDPETCINCDLCVDACPVKAIYPEDDVPSDMVHFIEINARHYMERNKK